MKRFSLFVIFIVIIFCTIHAGSTSSISQPKPDFGVILNEDGDFAFVSPDPILAERILRSNVDGHAALGIKTYVFCIGAGSDALYYPTKVSSQLGWRKTKYEENDSDGWRSRMENARACLAAGLNAVQIAGDQAKKNDLLFIPSLRMNDSHFMADPYNYPLTGKFWLDNTDLIIKDSPVLFNKNYANLLDYTHEKVRNFRLAIFNEVVDRNKNSIDGFELDFNRVQVFFPKGKADAGAPLLTGLVRTIRRRLDVLSKEQGRPMYLFVRIPPSEEACKWAGLDIETWMKEGLVDLISPAQLMTLAHDMPIAELTKKAHKYNVQIYPSMYPRTSFRVPFVPSEAGLGMKGAIERSVSLAEALGAAANYRWMGADGFYLFNYYYPHPDSKYVLVAALSRNKRDANEKVFAITKTYYNDDKEPSYAYVKQLPKTIYSTTSFNILIGELPQDSPFPVTTCALRLGLKNFTGIPAEVTLNGHKLSYLAETDHTKLNNGKPLQADMAARSLIYPINDLSNLISGDNRIIIMANGATITDIEIGYAYFNDLGKMMTGSQSALLNSSIVVK